MGKFKKIIFLDEDNTMLGPYAEAVLRRRLAQLGLNRIQVASRGRVVLFPEPVNQKICLIAHHMGITLETHMASQIRPSDFSDTTLVLVMDEDSKNRIYRKYKEAVNVFTLKSYVDVKGGLKLPIGGDIKEYEAVCRELDGLLELLIEKETDHDCGNRK